MTVPIHIRGFTVSMPTYVAIENLTGRNCEVIPKGKRFTLSELPDGVTPDRIRELCDRKMIRPFGNSNPLDSLLVSDNPTTQEYKEEVGRLQIIIEDQSKEIDSLKLEAAGIRDGFASRATAGIDAIPVPIAADNTARKRVRELEEENNLIRRQAIEERQRMQQQIEAMNKRLTEVTSSQ